MSLLIGGVHVEVPGLMTRTWEEAGVPRLELGEDARRRKSDWVRLVVLHTTKGIPGGRDHRPQKILLGMGAPSIAAERVAHFWSSDPTPSGAHVVVDRDGDVLCLADLARDCAFHAGPVNDVSIGIEIYQGKDAEIYEGQLEATVVLCDFLARTFGIQRQWPLYRTNVASARLEAGGRNVVGFVGHRSVTTNRGTGDPGDPVFSALYRAGYERHDIDDGEDRRVWHERQQAFGWHVKDCDGVPGPATVRALKAAGKPHGLWVSRPGD